ncbi:putative ribonuclease H-like domain-containing protein [Tanacetum coccineum]
MADNRTMAQMLQAPIEGYEDAIVVPPINANNFELKQPLINLVQSNKFTGRQDPHNHLRFFNKVTSTFRHPEVPNTSVKLLLFPFSLDGEARDWLDKEPPRSILTWDDLVSKFINQFFPPSKTTYLRNKITNFFQEPNETFNEAWERFKGLGNVTPLFDSLLVEGKASERPSESQPIPSPPHPSEDQPESQPDPSPRPSPSIPIYDSNPEGSGGNHGGQSSSDRSLSGNEDSLTLQSVYDLCGRKTAKSKPTAHKDQAFDDLDDFDAMDYMETEDAHNEKGVSTEDQVSTVKPDEGTDKPKVSTDKIDEGTAELKNGNSDENATPTATPIVFGDDETIAEFLVSMSQNKAKQKGVEIKDAEDSDRPRPTSTRSLLTLKPLPKIDPKDKGKKVLEEEAESDAESEGVNEAERKFAQLANDEEIARKVQEEWETEEEKKKLAEEEATKAALIRGSLLNKATAIRSRPPTRTQLRNQMMTYLKHVGGKKHSDLKNKNFEEIQALYEMIKRSDENFVAIGSVEDEKQIKEKNEESKDPKKKRVVNETPREEDIAKVHAEQEVTKQGTKKRKSGHVKMIARKRPRPQPDDDSDDEHRKCLRIVTHLIVTIVRKINGDQNLLFLSAQWQDLFHLYDLVMKQYLEITPEGLEVEEESTAALHLISDGGFVALEEVLKRLNYRKKVKYNKEIRTLKIFNWVFFLATKDETPEILKNFITGIENQSDHKVKTIRSDNGTEFKNRIMNEFCEMKGIRREFSVARTPQQNGVAKRKNMTLIKAAKTMLADSKLPTTFWAEAVNTVCYVQNILVLGVVIKPHNKTPYKFFLGKKHALSFMRPFGCPVTILNTIDHLGNQTNGNAGTKENIDARQAEMNTVPGPQYVLLPFLTSDSQSPKNSEDKVADDAGKKNGVEDPAKEGRGKDHKNEFESVFGQDKDANSTYRMFTPVSTAESSYENLEGSTPVNAATPSNDDYPTDPLMPDLEDTADLQDTRIFDNAYDDEDVGAEADLNNLETTMSVSPIPTTRIHRDHPKDQILRDLNSATQTRRMIKMSEEHAMISYINKQRRTNHKDYQNCLFACFLSQIEPKKVIQALADPSWVEAMQEELLQFRFQKVWRLVDLPKGKHAIGTKWVYRNKKDERGIVVRNKARLVAQGYTQEE